ncbi:MAG: DUF882 domain-containing protein [Alphaproteobacteria bacterium]|nr:MAG: DUF882 domain-containing protein [Alphaproteobacteria bacterium]
MDRRGFLRMLGGTAAALIGTTPAVASVYGDMETFSPVPSSSLAPATPSAPVVAAPSVAPASPLTGSRSIALYHPTSGESFIGEYWRDGDYLPDAMDRLTWFMRDRARGQRLHSIDPGVFDFIRDLAAEIGWNEPVHLISGYRAGVPRTRRASRDSRHLEGKAVDIRLPGHNLGRVGRVAISMKRGGVGLYRSSHLHLDTGPVRTWGRG